MRKFLQGGRNMEKNILIKTLNGFFINYLMAY